MVFLGFALAFALGGCTSAPRDMALVDSGAGAFVAGDTAGAEKQLREALAINPDNAYALITLAAIFERTGRADEARKLYGEVAARGGAAESSPLGVEAEERAALAALARERLAALDAGAKEGRKAENESLETVFANLAQVTGDLRRLSSALGARAMTAGERAEKAAAKGEARPRTDAGEPIVLVPQPADASAPAAASEKKPPPPATAKAAEAKSASAEGIRLHIASYRTKARARKGWREEAGRYPDLLGGLDHAIVRVDLGPGMGVFYRVLAGPVADERAARALCARLKVRGAYCALVFPEAGSSAE